MPGDDREASTKSTKSVGCRICDCPGYLQNPKGGIVCNRPSCRHNKGAHG